LAWLDVRGTAVLLRTARPEDLPEIVALLAADQLGAARDGLRGPDDVEAYESALSAIKADPNQLLVVAVADAALVATFQLSFLPGLARRGSWRAQLEAVRVLESMRGGGLGTAMMQWAIEAARARGCRLLQLTTDKSRTDAKRFYEQLGFAASHEGMKLRIDGPGSPPASTP
jgi:GNAT superfamily N-acetyltransferase